ncbi:MAG: hypothetical protein NTU76_00965 [Candidatus Taylorbacteria bacterium]|nr:hypothetical protein [Candidatus Taylorbacteria bacterium]
MKKYYLPIAIFLLSFILGYFLYHIFSNKFILSDSERLQLEVNSFIAYSAVISAIIVVSSYIKTNEAFILGKKPALLVQIVSRKIPDKDYQETVIHYENITINSFEDLTFELEVSTKNKCVNLDNLFREKMNMPGKDSRERIFDPVEELKNKSFDLLKEAQNNNITLSVNYKFTFLGKEEVVLAQKYNWDKKSNGWNIL